MHENESEESLIEQLKAESEELRSAWTALQATHVKQADVIQPEIMVNADEEKKRFDDLKAQVSPTAAAPLPAPHKPEKGRATPFYERKRARRRAAKEQVDYTKAFVVFCKTGSLAKAAEIARVNPADLAQYAANNDWPQQLASMSRPGEPKQVGERIANRAVSFNSANRLRLFADQILSEFIGAVSRGEKTAIECISEIDCKGNTKLNTRLLADLSKAVLAADTVTSKALGDTISERLERTDKDEEEVDPQLSVLAALAGLSRPEPLTIEAPSEPLPQDSPTAPS